MGVAGTVLLGITIATDGSVQKIRVVQSIPLLDKAAIDAVSKWRYTPYLVNGVPTAIDTVVSVNFAFINAPQHTVTVPVIVSVPQPARPTLPPPPDGVLRVSAKAMEAQMEKRVEPIYTAEAAEIDARGIVFVLLTISKSGTVSDAQVLAGADWFRNCIGSCEAVEVQTLRSRWRDARRSDDGKSELCAPQELTGGLC
jgi:TonB family protein